MSEEKISAKELGQLVEEFNERISAIDQLVTAVLSPTS
jgi:hypothetical protein